jgi:hypothetical protein
MIETQVKESEMSDDLQRRLKQAAVESADILPRGIVSALAVAFVGFASVVLNSVKPSNVPKEPQ